MKTTYIRIFLIALTLLMIVSCAAGPNTSVNVPDASGNIAGFWQGIWHGFIAIVTFIWSLFSENVHCYEVHNNGWPYNLGFLLGLCILSGSGAGSAAKCKSKK